MEIYFYSGIVQNPVPFMDYMWKKHSLEQKMDERFGGHVIYISPQGVEMNFNSRYVRLADRCPFDIINDKKVIPASSPLRPLLEDLIKQFGSRRKIVTVVGEAVETAWLMKDLLPSKDIQSEQ